MGIGDVLKDVGKGAEAVGRYAEPVLQRTAQVLSGEAPQIDEEKRRQAYQLEDAAINAKADYLEQQLALGQKYGTLTPDQQNEYVNQITSLFSQPRHAGSLLERLRRAASPMGEVARMPEKQLPTATPQGGTAQADFRNALELAQARMHPHYVNIRNPLTGEQTTVDTNAEPIPPGWVLSGTSTGYIRQTNHILNPKDALALMSTHEEAFKKQDGTPWTAQEIQSLPQGVVLAGFIEGDQTFYAPFDERTKTTDIGNVVYQVPEGGDVFSNLQPIGVAKTPESGVTTQTSPGGQQVVSGTTRRVPVTMGAFGAKPVAPPSASTGARRVSDILGKKPIAAKSGEPDWMRQGAAEAATQSGGIYPNIMSMTPHNAQLATKQLPAVTAELGIYGDPQNPHVPSLSMYAPLANSPHAKKVLGEAFKLLDQQMGEISDPGIIATLATKAGWANFRAKAEAEAQQKTGDKMTQEERNYFDAAIASMADIIGARAATGQSSAKFSVNAIQNELPLIGLSGTTNEDDYYNKLETIAKQINVGLRAMPDNQKALDWLYYSLGRIKSKRHENTEQHRRGVASAMTPSVSMKDLKDAGVVQ